MRRDSDYEDDGRTIASMDVDGIRDGLFSYRRKRPEQKRPGQTGGNGEADGKREEVSLSKEEERLVTRGIWLAHLVTGLIFIGFFALFLLFCQFIWFK